MVAAIVAAVLLADRLGGPDQLGLRLYQVATGFAPAIILGGVLLFVGSGGGGSAPTGAGGGLGSLFSIFGAALGGASESRDIAYFIVLLVVAWALLGYGLWRWDMEKQAAR